MTLYTDLLLSNASRIGQQGMKEAFTEYLVLRGMNSQERNSGNLLSRCLYDDLGGLAALVCEVADSHSVCPLDRFMSFCGRNWKASRSQWSHDMFVLFACQGTRNGRYLEIGGADGITHSNTLALRDQLGWQGVLVEPHPRQFEILRFFRGQSDKVLNVAAAGPDAGGFVQLIDAGQFSRLEMLHVEDLHSDFLNAVTERITVRQQSMESLMTVAAPLDYLSLDVEGAETDLLKWIPWGRIAPPRLITVEHNWREADISSYRELLGRQGYVECFPECQWLRRGDLWFASAEHIRESGTLLC